MALSGDTRICPWCCGLRIIRKGKTKAGRQVSRCLEGGRHSVAATIKQVIAMLDDRRCRQLARDFLLAGVPVKIVADVTGLPVRTVRYYSQQNRERADFRV